MRNLRSFVLLSIVLGLAACSGRQGLLTKVWFYSYAEDTDTQDPADSVLTPVNFINLESRGKYTASLDKFEHGTWTLKDREIVLTPASGKSRTIIIRKLGEKEMIADVNAANGASSWHHFEGLDNPVDDEKDSPFSVTNNKWRVKATQKETPQQVTERLINYFRFWEKYFGWGLESDKNSLDVRSLPGPLKMYGNGFALIPVDQWPAEWSNYFFDQEDRQVAFDKIRWVLRNKKVAWPETGHRFKQFMSVFQQMQNNIKAAP
ncbi:hypothetical protein HHL16_18175 [Pseudoflavitalea sp. G-6-1-2]|uniref:hypothetical protein n=1 Tax=Pseudoflavitalea sp. G-6-1-2 TaxID=2728841 RepID=UPI00146E6E1C|nr:hypothetical protein [Pseudoflavitalea sp. G-6-1-2]NML22818.1 hypothetical protein [Pseudoflavitalea sp. G-6-1-2]